MSPPLTLCPPALLPPRLNGQGKTLGFWRFYLKYTCTKSSEEMRQIDGVFFGKDEILLKL